MTLTFIKSNNEHKIIAQFEPFMSTDKEAQHMNDVYIENTSNRLYSVFGRENVFICTNHDEINIVS